MTATNKKKVIVRQLLLLGILILTVSILTIQNRSVTTSVQEDVNIDWNKGYIQVTGVSAPVKATKDAAKARAIAARSAIVNAEQKFRDVIYGIALDSSTVGETVVKKEDIQKRISQAIGDMKVLELKYLSNGSCQLKALVPLYGAGSIAEIVYPFIFAGKLNKNQSISEINVPDINSINNMALDYPEAVYTGLIVDARTTDLAPAMSPKIVTESGDEVYGTMKINPDYVMSVGMASYTNTIREAEDEFERVGANPLVVKAIDAKGPVKAKAVISDEDGNRIVEATDGLDFLAKNKVVFVTR